MISRGLMVACALAACGDVSSNPTTPDAAPTVDAPVGPPDTDGDGLSDADEQAGWTIMVRTFGAAAATSVAVTSDPAVADTDGDGRDDGQEKAALTNPTLADTDDDGLTDAEEVTASTDPADYDSDDNKLADGTERKGLMALYRIDGLVGGKIADTSGRGKDATPAGDVAGFTLTTDRFNRAGRALYHTANGVNTAVNGWAGADIGVLDATSWTLSMWVRSAAVTGYALAQPGHFAFGVDVVQSGTQRATITVGGDRLGGGGGGATDFSSTAWHNWVVVRSGADVTMYLDGALVYTGTSNFAANTCSLFVLWATGAGCTTTPGSGFEVLDGALDDVRVWNRPLAAREAMTLALETANP